MRFSVWPTTTQSWQDLHALARHAAATGWDGLWVADHFMAASEPVDGPMLECWSVLAGLATSVGRLRIGPLVSSNTYRHPAVLANMASTIDQLSGGRFVLGLGAGWQENEHVAYGLPYHDVPGRLARLEEACVVLRALFDEPRAEFSGRFYALKDAPMEPKPVQAHLPLLIGGGGEKVTLKIVARVADEWNTWGLPEVLAQKGAVLARHCEAIGRDPATIAHSAQVLVDLDGSGELPGRLPGVRVSAAELEDLLGRYDEAGVDEFILPDWNLGTGRARTEVLDRFIGEIAAPFRDGR